MPNRQDNPLLREVLGDSLRDIRTRQGRTLREVSSTARVSLGYLSEVERGEKEASSELLAAISGALDVSMAVVLDDVARRFEAYASVTVLPVRTSVAA